MKIKQLTESDDQLRAILFYGGWGSDPSMLNLKPVSGYDLFVVYDYTDMSLDVSPLKYYCEVVVVAWSFGVAMAAMSLDTDNLPITKCIAINGTEFPVDERRGIPPAIFEATLKGLNATTLKKFDRRMCGGAEGAAAMPARERGVDELRAELEAIATRLDSEERIVWDEVYISRDDMIFPAAAQREAWAGGCRGTLVFEIDGPHLPDLNMILNRSTVDKDSVASKFTSAVKTYDDNASVQKRVAQTLVSMMLPFISKSSDIIEIGSGTGVLTRMLREAKCQNVLTVDIAENLNGDEPEVVFDAELFPALVRDKDVLVSASALQWFNSPRTYLSYIGHYLHPGGVVAIAVYGDRNFSQLDAISPDRRRFPTFQQWLDMFPVQLEILDSREETIDIEFDTPRDVLNHIKATGVNGSREKVALRQFVARYPRVDDKIILTYHPIWIVARRR